MIDVKTAANASVEYLRQLVPDANNVQLEEVEISEDEKFRSITVSFYDGDTYNVNFNRERKYKILKIDADTGNVQSMKIRELL